MTPKKTTFELDEPIAVTDTPKHALDDAPVGSKIVNTGKQAWIALVEPPGTPEDTLDALYARNMQPRNPTKLLPAGDLAHKLPNGAKITKTGPQSFTAISLDPAVGRSPLVTATAFEAIYGFIPHFHDGAPVK